MIGASTPARQGGWTIGQVTTAPLTLDPLRLLPPDPGVRRVAAAIHHHVAGLPIISPHGHVDARVIAEDAPFPDPTALLVTPDHYVTRLLHADGVDLAALGVGHSLDADGARAAWRTLCERWSLFRGTPVRYWLQVQLHDIFGVTVRPSAATADSIYDQVAETLADQAFRPRALMRRFGIEVLATTDAPADDLAAHAALRDDPTFAARVLPTFRPDRLLDPGAPGWQTEITALATAAGVDTGDYAGYVAALESRRRYFVAHGAVSADHGHPDAASTPLDPVEAARIYRAALAGHVTPAEAAAFRGHMLSEMARMSCEDGLVMTLHPGVLRSHHRATFERFGTDTGHDIPVRTEYTRALRPLLTRYGTAPGFHLVLFTVDETTFSREIAPLAGFYPSVYVGAPWWFLDAPDAIRRYRASVTETVGFNRTSGFIDDTRAFCSIPARHDLARRVDAGYLAGLVAEHRLDEDEAFDTARELVDDVPRRVFKL